MINPPESSSKFKEPAVVDQASLRDLLERIDLKLEKYFDKIAETFDKLEERMDDHKKISIF
jgi:hypothetical protein